MNGRTLTVCKPIPHVLLALALILRKAYSQFFTIGYEVRFSDFGRHTYFGRIRRWPSFE